MIACTIFHRSRTNTLADELKFDDRHLCDSFSATFECVTTFLAEVCFATSSNADLADESQNYLHFHRITSTIHKKTSIDSSDAPCVERNEMPSDYKKYLNKNFHRNHFNKNSLPMKNEVFETEEFFVANIADPNAWNFSQRITKIAIMPALSITM